MRIKDKGQFELGVLNISITIIGIVILDEALKLIGEDGDQNE